MCAEHVDDGWHCESCSARHANAVHSGDVCALCGDPLDVGWWWAWPTHVKVTHVAIATSIDGVSVKVTGEASVNSPMLCQRHYGDVKGLLG